MKKLKEADILKACQDLLAAEGIPCYRMQSGKIILKNGNGSRRCIKLNPEGTPDLLVHYGSLFENLKKVVWIETKAPGKSPTAAQEAFAYAARLRGEYWLLVDDSKDIADWLKEMRK